MDIGALAMLTEDEVLGKLENIVTNLVRGLIVLVLGLLLVKVLLKLVRRSRSFQKANKETGGFLDSVLRVVLYSVLFVTAIGAMGVPLSSMIALLSAAGVAISLGMQGAVSNFVGGLIILTQHLFKAGDYISVGTSEGTVDNIGTFYTHLVTTDNKGISLPNSALTNTAIVNYSSEELRMVETTYILAYDSDLETARKALLDCASQSGLVTEDALHRTEAYVNELGEYSVKMNLRCWTGNSQYRQVKNYLLEHGKKALDKEGIQTRMQVLPAKK